MQVQRLTATDGFIVWDLEAAGASAGQVRLAPKVLRDGAVLLARSVTYTFASFRIAGRGGASCAINAKPDSRDDALASWVDEVRPLAEGNHLRLWPGAGIGADDLAPLGWAAPEPTLTADGALAAAGAVLAASEPGSDGFKGRKVAVVGSGAVAEAATARVAAAGGELTEPRFDVEADVLLVEGKAGVLDHETATGVQAKVVVPLSPVPVTARALAILGRAGTVVVPDFLSVAAPVLAAEAPDGPDPVERVSAAVAELAPKGTDMWLAAAMAAEDFLATWTAERPFGRPLA